MPVLPQIRIPPPKGGDEFEQMTLAAVKMRWLSPNFQRHGRQGQAQQGVDLYGEDDLGRKVGVQCKNWNAIDEKTIKEEVINAEAFQPPIAAMYVAVALPTDANLQKTVRLLSEDRVKAGKFPVGMLFWEDVCGELIKNPAEFRNFYPQFDLPVGIATPSPSTAVAALDLAYQGTCIVKMAHLVLGDYGQMSGTPPRGFLITLREIGQASTFVYAGESGQILAKACLKAEEYLIAKTNGELEEDGWQPFEDLLHDIETQVGVTPYGLRRLEIAAYSLGQILSRWYISERDETTVPSALRNKIKTFLAPLGINADENEELKAIYKRFENTSIAPEVVGAGGVYNLARSALLELMLAPSV